MSLKQEVTQIVITLGENLEFFEFKPVSYPLFAQFLRQEVLNPTQMISPLTNDEKRIFNKYERALAAFWTAFPDSLHKHFITKDVAFFLLCLFIVKPSNDQKVIRSIWARTPSIPEGVSPSSNLKYYAPGDYLSLLAPRTKSQRFWTAQQILNMYESSLFSPEVYPAPKQATGHPFLQLEIPKFLEEFHQFVFSSPKHLTYNDLCLLTEILTQQSDSHQQLISACQINKNTVSTRVKWMKDNHVIYHRPRIAYEAFNLQPVIILKQIEVDNKESEETLKPSNPWIVGDYLGSENRTIQYRLIPNEPVEMGVLRFESRSTSLLFHRITQLTYLGFNSQLFDPSTQTWDFNFLNLQKENLELKPIVIQPFKDISLDNFSPSGLHFRVLNFLYDQPAATYREICTGLKISSATLTSLLDELKSRSIIKWIFGLYPTRLPLFASFFVRIRTLDTIESIIRKLALYVPILQGGGLKGPEYIGFDLQIPFPDHRTISSFHTLLTDLGCDLVWFQVNDHPFAGHWRFPLQLWDEKEGIWIYTHNQIL